MTNAVSNYMWNLQLENRELKRQIECYRNGRIIQEMCQKHEAALREKDREIAHLKAELAKAHAEIVTVRNNWAEVFEDVEREKKKELGKAATECRNMEKRAAAAEEKASEAQKKLKKEREEKYKLGAKLEEAEEQNKKLTAQVNKDFENSSLPSSMGVRKRKITSCREHTDKKRGGQAGHKGHGRKKLEADEVVVLEISDEIKNNPRYYPTGKFKSKLGIEIEISVHTTEYRAEIWRDRDTGNRVTAVFPEGIVDDVNYGGSVKAAAFLLTTECDVSAEKTRQFLFELSGEKLDLSIGMINGLCDELSAKTEAERSNIIERLMLSPVMNVDFTNANVNGEGAQVMVLASEQENVALYIAREHKGHKGVQGTPLENYTGTVTHDHDITFYTYGLRHQECQQHNLRYAKGSIENEPNRKWNKEMHSLIQEMIHYRNGLGESDELDQEKVAEFERRYDEIIEIGRVEYEDVPPAKYYRDGHNLWRRLQKYKESELLFLHDKNVPTNNSVCERLARVFKRKQKQATVFRSFESLGVLCNSLSIVHLVRHKLNENVFTAISNMFRRKRPIRKKNESLKAAAGA